jgi:alpha-1,3-mannosyltransferase
MLSVLHVCTDFWPITGGIQTFVLELSKRTQSLGVNAAVFCCNGSSGYQVKLPAADSVEGIRITRAPYLDFRFYKPTSFSGVSFRDYDVIHVHGLGAQLDYLALSKPRHRRPIILSTHGGIFHTRSLRWLKLQYFYRLQPRILSRVDLVAACSSSDANLFNRVSSRVQLVENGVDVDDLLALPMSSKRRNRCLYVGRLAANKGIDLLLNAVAHAKRRGAIFNLRLAGPDPEQQGSRYEELASQLGLAEDVHFLGTLGAADLMREYELADVFVSASRYEGFGISAIEARAAGCRLLLQRNEAFAALFASDSTVTLVDFQSAADAGDALLRLLEHHSNASADRSGVERYSWSRKAHEWLAIYERLVGREPGRN